MGICSLKPTTPASHGVPPPDSSPSSISPSTARRRWARSIPSNSVSSVARTFLSSVANDRKELNGCQGRQPRPVSGPRRSGLSSEIAESNGSAGQSRLLTTRTDASEMRPYLRVLMDQRRSAKISVPNGSEADRDPLYRFGSGSSSNSISSGAGSQPLGGKSAASSVATRLFSCTSRRSAGEGKSKLRIKGG
jgi:hypothetical protein